MVVIFIYYLLFNLSLSFCSASLSGLYVDNGADKTVIQHVMSEKEKQFISEDLLNLLGLPNRPRVRRDQSKQHLHRSAPKYLINVFNVLSDFSPPFNLTETDLNNIDESDVILTIVGHNIKTKIDEKRKCFWFDLSGVSVNEENLGGELRLFKKSVQSQPETFYDLSVFMREEAEDGNEELKLIDSRHVKSSFEGWLSFNMTAVLTSWIVFPNSNKGIYIVMHSTDSPDEEMELSEGGIVVEDVRKEHESFLVVYLRAARTVHVGRVRRETKHRSKKAQSSYPNGNPLIEPSSQTNRNCQIQTLYVSFKDLKWHDWIIAPEGYGAFYCSGECNFPLNAHMNATNHAIVQTLVHLNNPVQVPRPCCAPTKLTPISVLYFQDDSSNVILKKYKNMVVKSCGCH